MVVILSHGYSKFNDHAKKEKNSGINDI